MKKKRWKRILLIVLIAVGAVAAAGFIYASPMLAMHPTPTGPVADTGILSLHSGANSLFFIPTDDGYILVDTGSGAGGVSKGLPEIGVDPGEVRYVLLTHSDYDHVGAARLFSAAQVYMSADELQMLNGAVKRNAFSRNGLPEGMDAADFTLLEDGQRIELGGRSIACIAAPGHTPGSMAFLVDDRFLFTGDAFRVKDDLMTVHPFTMDSATAGQSIKKLYAAMEGCDLVLSAHYGWYTPSDLRQ